MKAPDAHRWLRITPLRYLASGVEREERESLFAAQVAERLVGVVGVAEQPLSELVLALEEDVDPLLERPAAHELVDDDSLGLANPEGAVHRLILGHGLPMLVIPLFGDQILNAMLVERAGLGRHLPLKKATPEAIRDALRTLLADDAFGARGRRVAAEIKQLRGDQIAARALEKLAFGARQAPWPGNASLSTA